MAKVTTMEELFLDEIRDLHDAESQLTKALPEMAEAASSDELRNAFEEHFEQTVNQVKRLEHIFVVRGEKPTGKKCAAMTALIKEANETVSAIDEAVLRDAGLIAAAQYPATHRPVCTRRFSETTERSDCWTKLCSRNKKPTKG
jgi:ferritin-like metal-binding protein YciE